MVWSMFMQRYLELIKKIYYKEQLNLDISKILKNINKKTKLIILANPNSPTGTIIEQKNLLNITKRLLV